jgi:hypothetical protein
MTPAERESVRQRAGSRGEYCHLPDSAMVLEDFRVELAIARKHRGTDGMENLAWCR